MTDADFLAAIATRPGDDLTRLVYADWLDEQGDPRAEYVRLTVALADQVEPFERTPRLHELAALFDAGWRAGVGVRYDVLLASYPYSHKISIIMATRAATGWGLAEAVSAVEYPENALLAAALREEAEEFLARFVAGYGHSPRYAGNQLALRRTA